MIAFAIHTILIAWLAAFLLCLLIKWGVVEWLQVHGNDFFAKMSSCHFCLSWWAAVAVAAVAFAVTGDWSLLLCPFFSTVITRNMIMR